jgi:hypothetical protein
MAGFRKATGESEWRSVVGWEGVYDVDQYGNIRRVKPSQHTTVGRVRVPSADRYGYLRVTLRDGQRAQTYPIHRAVALAFLGQPPAGHEVNHQDTVKTNNHVSNLEYLTPGDNSRHAASHGLRGGEANANAKLTIDDIVEIRAAYDAGGCTQTQLAQKHGVSQVQISNIVRRRHGGWANHKEN